MSPFFAAVAGCRYGLAEPWGRTGPRCEEFADLQSLAVRVEGLRRRRGLSGWRLARFVWGAGPAEQRRKVEVDVIRPDGVVALTLSLLVQDEDLATVAAAILAARPEPSRAA